MPSFDTDGDHSRTVVLLYANTMPPYGSDAAAEAPTMYKQTHENHNSVRHICSCTSSSQCAAAKHRPSLTEIVVRHCRADAIEREAAV